MSPDAQAQTTHAIVGVPGPGAEHEESAFGLGPPGWVALAMIVVLAIAAWQRVPRMIGAMLDRRIADIRTRLDEAKALRDEAEALLAEAKRRQEAAHADARAILDHAEVEAGQLVEKARSDADLLVERRGRMAEEKIAAAERTAIADVRARAASAAAAAAARIIAERHDHTADRALIGRTIAGLG